MIRITTRTKVQIAPPDQGWSLRVGANHFESDLPDAVAKRLEKLQVAGLVTVDVLDGNGNVSPWQHSGVTDP